jgi:hypothetical protein
MLRSCDFVAYADNLLLYLDLILALSFYKDYKRRVERLEKDKLDDYQHKVEEII